MESKRVLIATALCLAILLGWSQLSTYMGWTPQPVPEQAQVEQDSASADIMPAQSPQAPAAAVFAPTEGRKITIDTPLYTAVINTSGGVLSSFKLKKYHAELNSSTVVEMISEQAALVSPMGILLGGQPTWFNGQWQSDAQDISLAENESKSIELIGRMGDLNFKRTLSFNAETYLIEENLELLSAVPANARLAFTLAAASLSSPDNSYDTMKLVYENGDLNEDLDVDELTETGFTTSEIFNWAGVASNYFLAAVAPVSQNPATLKARIQSGIWRVALEESDFILQANQAQTFQNYWWFGPKDASLLALAPQELGEATDMGMFDILARPLLIVMTFIYDNVYANWGIAIILLTILIKLIFWPLTRASFRSMEKMKRIQPMMKQLQEKYKDNKEQLSKEMMQLYKTYGVNPLGGCLPILIQIPVFFALYQALLNSLELRHSDFIYYLPFTDYIWLADLSAKDPFYITPIIMGGTMFLQQLLTPSMGDPTQRKMMLFMPIIFTFMFLNFPSGLVLYWLMSNVVGIAQQWYTLRKIK